jgi:hypothetical protein
MKEDILEQLVDDYLKFNGFFTVHNVKFQPAATDPDYIKRDDCVASDVDVIGFHPMREGAARVWVVSCKAGRRDSTLKRKLRPLMETK